MIREYTSADAAVAARIFGEAIPEKPMPTAEGMAHFFESHPPRAKLRIWLAEEDGRAVGLGVSRFNWSVSPEDTAWTWAGVVEDYRGRGIGGELFRRAEEHALAIGARLLDSFAVEDSPGQRFAEARGFKPTRREHLLRLDPAAIDLCRLEELEAALVPDGLGVVALRDAIENVEGLHAVYGSSSADIPATNPEADVRLEDFRDHVLGDPELSLDGSMVVLDRGRPVALSFLRTDPPRGVAINEMTGTLAAYRGRGLARLAKLAAIRWARDTGLRHVVTENDGANEAMLGLNRSLGYEVTHTRVELIRDPARRAETD